MTALDHIPLNEPFVVEGQALEIRTVGTGCGVWSRADEDWAYGGPDARQKTQRGCRHWLGRKLGLANRSTMPCPSCGNDEARAEMLTGYEDYAAETYRVTCPICGHNDVEELDNREINHWQYGHDVQRMREADDQEIPE